MRPGAPVSGDATITEQLRPSSRLPDAVPVVPADERLEGAALAPVTVGAHQTVRTRPVPDNTQHIIQISLGGNVDDCLRWILDRISGPLGHINICWGRNMVR